MPIIYLVPTPLAENTLLKAIPADVIAIIKNLQQFIVEDLRTARRFLSNLKHPGPIDQLDFKVVNEHTKDGEISSLLPFLQARNTGVLSEAGMPGIADPGSAIVRLAHNNKIKVVPLAGPSSIFMALMASGLNGQSFAFVGYIPVRNEERVKRLRALEQRSLKEQQTQIFIEAPYRNLQLLNDIMRCCKEETLLTIAADITGKAEFILTKRIKQWKNNLPDIQKTPTVFLIQA